MLIVWNVIRLLAPYDISDYYAHRPVVSCAAAREPARPWEVGHRRLVGGPTSRGRGSRATAQETRVPAVELSNDFDFMSIGPLGSVKLGNYITYSGNAL